jgi:hypothetical protein
MAVYPAEFIRTTASKAVFDHSQQIAMLLKPIPDRDLSCSDIDVPTKDRWEERLWSDNLRATDIPAGVGEQAPAKSLSEVFCRKAWRCVIIRLKDHNMPEFVCCRVHRGRPVFRVEEAECKGEVAVFTAGATDGAIQPARLLDDDLDGVWRRQAGRSSQIAHRPFERV